MSRYDGCWRWLRNRTDTVWYNHMRLFHQKAPYDWSGAIEELTAALAEWVEITDKDFESNIHERPAK
jgi:hypothetical protein